jgi:hypothetical protein
MRGMVLDGSPEVKGDALDVKRFTFGRVMP